MSKHAGAALAALHMPLRARAVGAALVLALASAAVPTSASAYLYWSGTAGDIARAASDGSGVDDAFVPGVGAGSCGLITRAGFIYWADSDTGTIGRANLDGTGADPHFVPGSPGPCGIAAGATHLYWVITVPGAAFGGENYTHFYRSGLDGAGATEILTVTELTCGIAVDGAHLYWLGGDHIGRANVDGTAPDSTFITGISSSASCDGLADDGAHLYWSTDRGMGRAATDASGVHNDFVTAAAGRPCAVAVDSGHVYWSTFAEGSTPSYIGRANLDGSAPNPTFITGHQEGCALAVDLYPHPTSTRVSCSPTTIAAGQTTTCTVTVADTFANAFGRTTPAGSVALASNTPGGTLAGCKLAPTTSIAIAGCDAAYTAGPSGGTSDTLTATYTAETTHATSAGTNTVAVTRAAPTGTSPPAAGAPPTGSSSTGPSSSGPSSGAAGGPHCILRIPRVQRPLAATKRLDTIVLCTSGLTVTERDAVRLHARGHTRRMSLGSRQATVRAGVSTHVALRLSRRSAGVLLAAIHHHRRLRLAVALVAIDAAGQRITATAHITHITLRRPVRRH